MDGLARPTRSSSGSGSGVTGITMACRQPGELRGLGDAGMVGLSTDYRESKRRDRWGNRFMYKGKVQDARGSDVGRWAYDVFLLR